MQNNCINNTSTDPAFPSPNTNDFRKNTFDWTSVSTLPNNLIPYAIWNINGWSINTITNPFWSTSSHMHLISAGINSDNKPQDGWELIKQDFGYFYDNNQWNGGIMGYGLPNDPRQYPSTVIYFLLYNKYTSTLRLIFKLTADNININTNKILVKFHLIYNNSNPVYSNMVLNGMFNAYNKIQYALDKKTKVTEISIPTTVISASDPNFSYCDINVSYDPCVCFFESSLWITFHTISTGYISLTGELAGFNGVPLVDINNNYIKGMWNSDNFVASIFEDQNNTPENVMQHYVNFINYGSDINNTNGNSAELLDYKQYINYLSQIYQLAGELIDPSGTIDIVSKVIGKFADFIDYMNLNDMNSNSTYNPYSKVSLITARMNINGTLTYNIQVPAQEIYTRVPGSLNAYNAPEYGGASFGTLPSYPMYNEALGLFSVLKTPIIECYKDINFFDPYNPNLYTQSNWTTFSYRPIGDIQFVLNPIINQNKSKIYIRYEIDGMPVEPQVGGPAYIAYDNQTIYGGWNNYYNDYGDVLPLCYSASNVGNIKYKYNKIVTPYYPIGCNSNISVSEKYIVHKQDKPDCFFLPLYADRKVILCVLLDLYFNIDNYGNEHHVIQIQKYNCDVVYTNNDFNYNDPNSTLPYVTKPYNLIVTNTSYSNSQEIFAYNDIKIQGTQSGNNAFIGFHAGNEISIENESDFIIDNEFDLNIQSVPQFFNICDKKTQDIVFQGNLYEYCNNQNLYASNQGYQASQPSSKVLSTNQKNQHLSDMKEIVRNNSQNKPMNMVPNFFISPNPASTSITIQTSNSANTIQHISIKDITGKTVAQQTVSPQPSTTLDISYLSNDLYFIEVQTNQGVFTEKVVVQR